MYRVEFLMPDGLSPVVGTLNELQADGTWECACRKYADRESTAS